MILRRYIFREIVASALLGTVLATFVVFIQGLGELFALLVRSSARLETVLYLFSLALPPVLQLTIPFGVLVGILIGLGRMSSDGEITAMRSAGVPGRRVVFPVLCFAGLACAVAGSASLWLGPAAMRESLRVINHLLAEQLTAAIQERVFDEQFPNTILYVGGVKPTGTQVVTWQNVFIANLTPPAERTSGLKDKAVGPMITIAREAVAVADREQNQIQLSFRDGSTHEVGADGSANDTRFPTGDQVLMAAPPPEKRLTFRAIDTRELKALARRDQPNWIEARIELHRRFALPLACMVLALVGIPLGVATRKGGKSAGYVTAIFLAFFCYHLASISLIGLAKERKLSVEVAVWLPDVVFFVAGLALLARLERIGDRDIVGEVRQMLASVSRSLRRRLSQPSVSSGGRFPLLPQLVDTYVLSQFLFYFALLLSSFVLMTEVFMFFELLGDIVRNRVAMPRVLTYLLFLMPKLIYDTLPISVLVSVLVTFGMLTKNNEVTAFKASGVSLYRLAMPVFFASLVLSGALFAFDYYYVPEANRKQDAIRDEIKGRPVQTYLRPDRKWIFGSGSRIYYYRHFDLAENVMIGVNVYELDPHTFRLVRQISAERAQWQPSLQKWIFQTGWRRDLNGSTRNNFEQFQATTFPELDEPPSYFFKEVKQDKQMNYWELDGYIRDLQQSGFDTVRLKVQWHKKFSVPLFALIMSLISVPFAFLVGNRGAMAGIGVSIGIAIAYWAVGQLFEQVGNVNHLPAAVAAWSPNIVFSLSGLYMFLRMRS